MVGSIDSLDFSPELTIPEERNSIPLNCWQDVCLSDIWIPSELLPSRKQPSHSRVIKGIFHTLEKKDARKCIESFSVYSEEEIFMSDSDEDILDCKDTGKFGERLPENILAVNALSDDKVQNNDYDKCSKSNQQYKSTVYEYLEVKKTSGMKTMPSLGNLCNIDAEMSIEINCHETTNIKLEEYEENAISKQERRNDSLISLHDILDDTPQFKISDFRTKNSEFLDNQEKKLGPNQKKNKKKKKISKHITLGEFRKGYEEADYQEACCNNYFQKLLHEKNTSDGVMIRNINEFPDLASKDIKFIHPEKLEIETSESNYTTFAEIINPSNEINENAYSDCNEKTTTDILKTESICGKLVIENIPNEVNKDDILSVLCGYGEIKNFSLKSTGDFLKAYVELELTNDIEWIIECLNGSEPFGASTKTIKCYQQK